jgi:hypothetical protein
MSALLFIGVFAAGLNRETALFRRQAAQFTSGPIRRFHNREASNPAGLASASRVVASLSIVLRL